MRLKELPGRSEAQQAILHAVALSLVTWMNVPEEQRQAATSARGGASPKSGRHGSQVHLKGGLGPRGLDGPHERVAAVLRTVSKIRKSDPAAPFNLRIHVVRAQDDTVRGDASPKSARKRFGVQDKFGFQVAPSTLRDARCDALKKPGHISDFSAWGCKCSRLGCQPTQSGLGRLH